MKKTVAVLAAWLRRPQPLFWLAVAACAGIFAADRMPGLPPWLLPGLLAAAVLTAWKWRGGRRAALLLACGAAFAWLHAWNDDDPLRKLLEKTRAPGAAVPAKVSGLIVDAPEQSPFPGGWSFPLRVEKLESIVLDGDFSGTTLYVNLEGVESAPEYGDRIVLTGLLRRPQTPRNPGEFDFPEFLRRQGMSAEFEATTAYGAPELRERGEGHPVIALALRARDWIGAAVTEGIMDSPDISATVRTMVLGTREKTPSEVEDAFKDSGTMHVFAVSGLHVAMFCLVVFWVLRCLPLRYGVVLAITLLLVFFYVFVTGLRPSALRAAIMGAVFLGAPLFDRESRTLNSMGAAALLLLAWNTQQFFQPGFTLSFGVILAIGLFYPVTRKWLRRMGEPDEFLPQQLFEKDRQLRWTRYRCKGLGFVRDSVCLSLVSTAGSAWLMVHYFNLITPIGIVANIFIVFLSNVILVVACVSLTTSAAGLGFISVLCNKLNAIVAFVTVGCAKWFASVPGGHVHFHPSRLWRGEVCEVTVLALDHGGGAIHIDTPDGRHWLIDTGGLKHFSRTVRPHLTHTPVNQLDGLILSHTDSYHTSGAANVRKYFKPEQEPSLKAGDELTLDAGVTLRCLFPPENWKASAADDRCAVYLLTYRGTRILMTNDAGFVAEKALLASGADLRADIFIKGRHGSDFSGMPEFINAVSPQAVIFTNDIFPDSESVPPEWMARVEGKGARLFDQRRTGAVVIRMDGTGTTVSAFSGGSELAVEHHPH